ncbi:MAG TPA: phosphotransferase [Longimicrobiaceae bacterium]
MKTSRLRAFSFTGDEMAEWDAERVVTPELALELVRAQFPGLGRTIEPFGYGWDNTAFLVDGDVVFRFPRRAVAVPLIELEARVLPRLAPRLPLPIPCPAWLGEPTEHFPWPFAGYRLLPGRLAFGLSDDERRAAVAPLAGYLRALHAIPTHGLGLPGDEWARTDFVRRMPELARRLRGLESAGVIDDARPWLRLYEDIDVPEPHVRTTLVHGDLATRHVLVDDARRVCGVIDWGDVHEGDPAVDLAILFEFVPARYRDEFLRVYGEVDARTLRTARLRAAFVSATSTAYAHSVGDDWFVPIGLTSMKLVLED